LLLIFESLVLAFTWRIFPDKENVCDLRNQQHGNKIFVKDIHIMIVDDEPSILELAQRHLELMGYCHITPCQGGQIALEQYHASTNPFDIIISDLNMPEMNGVEFLRHLSETDYSGGIILLSAEDERILEVAKDLAKARNLNVLGYISKPLNRKSLEPLISGYSPDASNTPNTSSSQPLDEITEKELRAGINGDELLVAFQAKVSIATDKVIGVEALARWNHSERGILPPQTFISLAERCQLIDELTYSMYRKSLSQMRDWLDKDIILEVSINISVNSFTSDGFADFLINTAEEYNVNPELIILEITESQLMDNMLECLEKLIQLRMSNFGLSIDDFGTGHSNMSQLKQAPFTELKIDRAFVNGASKDPTARSIFESSVNLAKKLHMSTVAEGVETSEDMALVKELGCDQIQGFYKAKPMFADEFEKFVQSVSKA
jgi:EAL domain-containing protein (putative c-di-GMP-specific phosphodiesterase class I)/FixJ family two-component response regulator